MTNSQRETARRHPSPLFRRVHRIASPVPDERRPGVRGTDLIVAGAWLGLIVGLLEVAAILIQEIVHPFVTPESLRTNHHFAWMIPTANLVLFATIGVLICPIAWLRSHRAARLAVFAIVALACLAPLLAIRGLHPVGAAVLALGLSARLSGPIRRSVQEGRRFLWLSLPLGVALLATLSTFEYRRVVADEARTLASLPDARPGTPNVLLIVLDTVRAESLSLLGYDRPTTPHLDRLAERGITFEQARAPSPWTLPTHASLFTGRWPHEVSAGAQTPLDSSDPTLAEFLSDAGYVTGGFVANTYFCNARFGLDRGFARYEDYDENASVEPAEILRNASIGRRIVDAAWSVGLIDRPPYGPRKDAARINRDLLRWLDEADHDGRPFFAFLNYFDAHAPYQPPAEFAARFGGEAGAVDATLNPNELRDLNPLDPTPEQLRRLQQHADQQRDAYDACIASIDKQIARLCEALDDRGLLDGTWVIVTSDHGEHFGEHLLFGHGGDLYREVIHIPLLLIPPDDWDGPRGIRIEPPVSLRDLPATIAELIAPESRLAFPGLGLAATWNDPDAPTGDVFAEVDLGASDGEAHGHAPALRGRLSAVIAEGFTYIRSGDGGEELFALDDPSESENLADSRDHGPVLDRLRARVTRFLEDE